MTPQGCIHPHLSCSTDCTCPCDLCADEARIGQAAAIAWHRDTLRDLYLTTGGI